MYGYRKSRSVIAALVAGLCAALFSVSSLAITIDAGPSDYRRWGTGTNTHTLDGLRSSTGQTIRMPPLNTNLNVTRNAVIPYNSLANGMRNFVRINPASIAASAAVTGLFLAVDWLWDESSGSWMKEGFDIAPFDDGYTHWQITNVHGSYFYLGATGESPIEACRNGIRNAIEVLGVKPASSGFACIYSTPSGEASLTYVSRRGSGCPPGYSYSNVVNACATPAFIDLDPSDWTNLSGFLPSADPDRVGTAGHDTQRMIGNPLPGYSDQTMTGPSSISGDTTTSTTTDPSTGQSTITETSTTTNISYGDTTITTTTTTTTTNYNSDGSVSSETVTETTPGQEVISGTASSWPGFCEWAAVVCNWLDWTKEGWPEEEPELPQVVDFTPDGDFQVGGPGSCPAPYVLSIGWLINQAFEVSYQPFCDLALIVNPLFLAFCYLVAGVLTVRSL